MEGGEARRRKNSPLAPAIAAAAGAGRSTTRRRRAIHRAAPPYEAPPGRNRTNRARNGGVACDGPWTNRPDIRSRWPAARRASNSAPGAGGPRGHARPGGGSRRRRPGLPRRRCPVPAGPRLARSRPPRSGPGNRRCFPRPRTGRPAGKKCSRSRSRLHPSPASGSLRPAGRKIPGTKGPRRPAGPPGRTRPAPSAAPPAGPPRRRSAATSAKARSNSEKGCPPPTGPTAGRRAAIIPGAELIDLHGIRRGTWFSIAKRGGALALQKATPAVEEPCESFVDGDWSRLLQGECPALLNVCHNGADATGFPRRISPGIAPAPPRCVWATAVAFTPRASRAGRRRGPRRGNRPKAMPA